MNTQGAPALNSAQSASLMIDDRELPANFYTGTRRLALPSSDLRAFLDSDLSVDRIDRILEHLWLVGRPYPPRPLNIQVVLDRLLVPTSEASLHLVWTTKKVFLKALPLYMLSKQFYTRYLTLPRPHGPALGLLCSYMSLMPTELDFMLAQQNHLVPSGFKWEEWRDLTRHILKDYPGHTVYDHVPGRYRYGELRLSRLDKIYRFRYGALLHGFSNLTGPNTYQAFFAEYHVVLTAAIVYLVVVLTAMQVGLMLDGLAKNTAFMRLCYGFTVFAMISPFAAVGSVAAVFFVVFLTNWWRTSQVHRVQQRRSGKVHV